MLAAAAVQLPAIWLMAAVTVALFGLLPRFTPVAWGVLVAVIASYFLGSVAGMPQWMLDLTPYAHLPHVPGEEFRATPVVWLLIEVRSVCGRPDRLPAPGSALIERPRWLLAGLLNR